MLKAMARHDAVGFFHACGLKRSSTPTGTVTTVAGSKANVSSTSRRTKSLSVTMRVALRSDFSRLRSR